MSNKSSEFQRNGVIPKAQVDREDDDLAVVAQIQLRLRRNGALSIEGNIGDKNFVLAMLDNARDAVLRQIPDNDKVVIPGKDVEVPEFGDFNKAR